MAKKDQAQDPQPEEPKDIRAMVAQTVGVDLLQALLTEIKLLPKPWVKLPQAKQDDVIERLQVGKCLRCNTDLTNAVAQGLRKWLEVRGRTDYAVRQRTLCADGYGRVWLLPAKSKTPKSITPVPVPTKAKANLKSTPKAATPATTKARGTPTLADLPRRVHRIE